MDRRPSAERLQAGEQRGVFHFTHPFHMLTQVDSPYLFTCAGCKEYGAGSRFRCQTCCGFELHDFCALAPPALRHHPFHPNHQLAFFAKTGGGFLRPRSCDVCGRAARGFAFRCTAASCGFEMHPCCAAMRAEMNFPALHQHPLALALSPPAAAAAACGLCQRKRSGLAYRCAACGYSLHAACAKDSVNGLLAHGFRSPPEKPSKLGAAARVATQALFGIIGGLIEGIGEGIGEAFVDSIGRGTTTTEATSSRISN
ncbi:uncharacterized protein LOC121977329 [Zingiber officinale]|uniref:uncharacterized protein LOC121977329 n=1 Tax=Zingiber officinale TaxID=94328 RepID=UPI001C4BB21A|nr:uncharacterized protein LOC121977329 [Zingiber officinale]